MRTPAALSRSVKAVPVNWLPWSELQICGGGSVALRADALAAEDIGLDRFVGEEFVQDGRGELRGAGGLQMFVEFFLRLIHELPEGLGFAGT